MSRDVRHTLDRMELDADVYTLARERTAYVMDTFDHIQVAFSGGKDSTAVLNVALEVAHSEPRFARHLPLDVYFFDEEAIPMETEAYVRRAFSRDDIDGTWLCLPVQHRNACSRHHPYWWPWAPEAQDKWCRELPPEAITFDKFPGFPVWPREARPTIPSMNTWLSPPPRQTAVLMGIRAQESIIRTRSVTWRKVDNFVIPIKGICNAFKVYPVYDWRTEDVWAAPKLLDWDYNHAYDLLEMAGVPASMQRCSPAFGEEPLQKIHTYAQCFPDVWAKMSERVPGIGSAARYALTELYAYKTRPEKPADMSWPDWCAHYLKKFQPKEAAMVAERLRDVTARHYRRTRDPIAAKAPHPDTGVSWHFLFTLAARGDFKKRKQEGGAVGGKPMDKLWAAYTADLAASLADGTTHLLGYPRAFPTDPYALIPPQHRMETP